MPKTMLIYDEIVPLSREEHKDLKYAPATDMLFAADTHFCPLAGTEMPSASQYYPILFMGDQKAAETGTLNVVAILGLTNHKNDFIDDKGKWLENIYIPAFIRCYPFISGPGSDGHKYTLFVDKKSATLTTKKGIPLFNEDGSNSKALNDHIQFNASFSDELEFTKEFMWLLTKYNLLTLQSFTINHPSGEKKTLYDFWTIDENKFGLLEGNALAEFHEKGFLAWIFAQLNSLNLLPSLFNLHLEKHGRPDSTIN